MQNEHGQQMKEHSNERNKEREKINGKMDKRELSRLAFKTGKYNCRCFHSPVTFKMGQGHRTRYERVKLENQRSLPYRPNFQSHTSSSSIRHREYFIIHRGRCYSKHDAHDHASNYGQLSHKI